MRDMAYVFGFGSVYCAVIGAPISGLGCLIVMAALIGWYASDG